MKWGHLILPLFAAATLGACTLGPDYAVPKAAVVNDPAARTAFVGPSNGAATSQPLPDNWWHLYDDPALDRLVADALAANSDIRAAAANLARSEAVTAEVQSAAGLNGGAYAAAERAQLSGEQYLIPAHLPVMNLADIGLDVSYDLDLFGKLKRATEASRADAAARAAALDLVRVNVAAATTSAYLDACSANEGLATAHRIVVVQEEVLQATRRLVEAGRASAADLPRVRNLLDQARSNLPLYEARRQADLFRLAVLAGKLPGQASQPALACQAPPSLTQPIPVGDGAALLARRPDIRESERELAAATARIGVAISELYPDISLGASAGSTGEMSDIGQPQTNRWSYGPLVSWTFPTKGARARIRAANAAADGALANFDGVVLKALQETETALVTYQRDLERQSELRSSRDEASLAQSQAEQFYKAGRTAYLALLDARQTRAQADAALAAADAQIAADQARLFLALGGGWQNAPHIAEIPR